KRNDAGAAAVRESARAIYDRARARRSGARPGRAASRYADFAGDDRRHGKIWDQHHADRDQRAPAGESGTGEREIIVRGRAGNGARIKQARIDAGKIDNSPDNSAFARIATSASLCGEDSA